MTGEPSAGYQNFTPEDFAQALDVSRETLSLLQRYEALLLKWQSKINLVSGRTLPELWWRHFYDSGQLILHIPPCARSLIDLGSGAGFPGLVVAILLRDRLAVALVESDRRKAAFLKTVAADLGLPVTVHAARAEALEPRVYDVITARGLAPLVDLLPLAHRFTGPSTICLFLKGRQGRNELTAARKSWNLSATVLPSRTDPSGGIIKVEELTGAGASREP